MIENKKTEKKPAKGKENKPVKSKLLRPPDKSENCYSGPKIRVCNWKLFFSFLNQNICCGYSKEPSQWDGSFEHPKHIFKLMDKKISAILC